jgi:hypothetical protein
MLYGFGSLHAVPRAALLAWWRRADNINVNDRQRHNHDRQSVPMRSLRPVRKLLSDVQHHFHDDQQHFDDDHHAESVPHQRLLFPRLLGRNLVADFERLR